MSATRPAMLCLSEIDGFESLAARMPTADECTQLDMPAEVPVLVMRRRGREQLYRADRVAITIDTSPLPDADGTRELMREILHRLAEDIATAADDLTVLARALGTRPPRDVAAVADELRRRRAEQYAGAEALAASKEI